MIEKVLAGLGLLICVALAAHMALPLRARAHLIAWWRDPLGFKARARARRATESAIQRARRPARGRWKGNVYRLGDEGSKGDDDDGDEGHHGKDRRTLH